ncbi:MAG: hypothetical protein NZ824_12280 [Candidatus Thioglobus sp.]|nr:hypothetical protein [Candidatus Thioglobus sp.]
MSAGIVAAANIVGGIVGFAGHTKAANAAYEAGQVEYHQELERSHYEAKVLQRQMMEALHMQMAQAGAGGVAAGEGSPLVTMMSTLNDLNEDRTQILRNGAKNAWKLWNAGANEYTSQKYKATGSLLSGISGAAKAMG